MSIYASEKRLYSKLFRMLLLSLGFVFLVVLRYILGVFGISLGYLYVTLISISGFWFGITGGILAALAASVIFLAETSLFEGWAARDIVLQGILLRLFVYFLAGGVMGYLAFLSEKRKKQIQELNELKNKFIGIAAHDLRNPISIIRNCSNFLSADPERFSEEQKHKFAVMINKSSVFMLDLINDLLDISKIEAGELSLTLKLCDYRALVEETVDFNRLLSEKKNVSIEIICENSIPEMVVDKERMTQLLNNLLGNAIKYTYPGTTIKVKIYREEEYLVTKVIDQGQGLSCEDVKFVFNEFYKGEAEPTGEEGQKSTGLGLAISKKIVEGHGGTIGVESEKGKGAVFYFKIPVKE